ncbi:MAG: PKD domain-containing protein, partial [Bacteroidia bacterium]|nr:PKD domain-containing protein [Bacteroidia bacterium]
TSGTKTVKLKTISEFGCADSSTQTINLNESPLADFTFGAVCNQSNTEFKFTGTKPANPVLTAFNWDFDGYGSSTAENPNKVFSIIGKKTITLTLNSNNGCTDVISKEINVKLQSKADFSTADLCDDEIAVFTNKSTVSSGNLTFLWKFGDGTYSSSHSPRHIYTSKVSKTYNVTLVAIVPGGCSDSISKAITVNANPNSDFTYSKSGRLVYFKANEGGNTSYHWDFGEGGTSESANTQYHYINAFEYGKFNVCLTVENASGCFTQSCKLIEITGDVTKFSKNSSFNVYPNPSSGKIILALDKPQNTKNMAIYNSLGEKIYELRLNSFQTIYYIDLNIADGIYLLKLIDENNVYTQKITIKK